MNHKIVLIGPYLVVFRRPDTIQIYFLGSWLVGGFRPRAMLKGPKRSFVVVIVVVLLLGGVEWNKKCSRTKNIPNRTKNVPNGKRSVQGNKKSPYKSK